jgi:hypothetical protein
MRSPISRLLMSAGCRRRARVIGYAARATLRTLLVSGRGFSGSPAMSGTGGTGGVGGRGTSGAGGWGRRRRLLPAGYPHQLLSRRRNGT